MNDKSDKSDKPMPAPQSRMTRRGFLAVAGVAGAAGYLGYRMFYGNRLLESVVGIDNPLAAYPSRDWEKVYRDQYRYDRSFTWICTPNDTHMCRLRSFVRNGVVVRTEQNYDTQNCGDLYGNKMSASWNPRGCLKGLTYHRRMYGPGRLKGPVVRTGWKEWADDGFPSLTDNPGLRTRYRFDDRGSDTFVPVAWQEAARYVANGLIAIARTYSGDEGRRRLIDKEGYPTEMLEHWGGAGTRTIKMGSCLPPQGFIGKGGMFRFLNSLQLLDAHVRGVKPGEAKAGRQWTEYTWRGDQAPGQPFVHGLQNSDIDLADLQFSRLQVHVGKNMVENKMADSHWFIEGIERGAKIWVIAPEYSAPATKSDNWLGVRPGLSDTSIFLAIARILIEEKLYNVDFVKKFTDFPLLVRTDTLKRLRPEEVFANYQLKPLDVSIKRHGLTEAQRKRIGDFVVFDQRSGAPQAVSREDVGAKMTVDPALEGRYQVKTLNGRTVEVMPVMEMYRIHLKDYTPEVAEEISGAPAAKIRDLANDFATLRPAAIHVGEGINHYFHATLHNRAVMLPIILTGNIGEHGGGVHAWAGNYKGSYYQASPWTGPGGASWIMEDPFNPVLDEKVRITQKHLRRGTEGEEVGYWGNEDRPLIVNTPKYGRKCFTGKTHMPTPTKAMWFANTNLINQAKWGYNLITNVNPKVDMIVDQQVEWTGSAEYSDIVLPANMQMEFQNLEMLCSCSNPFLQVFGGEGIEPIYDSKDDAVIYSLVADALSEVTGDRRFSDMWHFIKQKKAGVYIQRVYDNSAMTVGEDGQPYKVDKILKGDYGSPGTALFLSRTYPRIPFWEQVHESVPFYTDSGRLAAYCDLPEAIEYGENLVVHREAVEATPYLPSVIVSTSPFVRPDDYGIPLSAAGAEERQVRNVKMAWSEVKKTSNPLWLKGYRFYCSSPKSRHSVHSSWSTTDWNWIWSVNAGDPLRMDKRAPGEGDREIMMNPQAALDLGIDDGDYVYVDGDPTDRPYRGWKPDEFRYRAFRCMLRVKFNPSLPYHFTIMKHTGQIASERSVRAHESRLDGRALAADTGYQASYRYGSHQSFTRAWVPPMHQLDTLFHKRAGAMGFVFGFDDDNHGINPPPKDVLVKITKAEPGGMDGKGTWEPATTGKSPGHEDDIGRAYLAGQLTKVRGGNRIA